MPRLVRHRRRVRRQRPADVQHSAAAAGRGAGLPGEKPAAIITDLDETALDNVVFEGRMVRRAERTIRRNGLPGSTSQRPRPSPRRRVPHYARSRGAHPSTSPTASLRGGRTLRNLQRLGFPLDPARDTLLVRGERRMAAQRQRAAPRLRLFRHRVLLTLGDDLNDFCKCSRQTREERDELVRSNTDKWGSTW